MNNMRIGDEVYVRGTVDEIRGATVIIKNKGGYFGTKKSEIVLEPQEYDEIVYDADKFAVLADDKRIRVIRKGRATVRVECEWTTQP